MTFVTLFCYYGFKRILPSVAKAELLNFDKGWLMTPMTPSISTSSTYLLPSVTKTEPYKSTILPKDDSCDTVLQALLPNRGWQLNKGWLSGHPSIRTPSAYFYNLDKGWPSWHRSTRFYKCFKPILPSGQDRALQPWQRMTFATRFYTRFKHILPSVAKTKL